MDYTQARTYITNSLKFGWRMGLDRMRALMADLGNPQDRLRCIHIAGTNGKGSTSMYSACALACADLRVGLFTSPFIVRFEERIRILDGRGGMARIAGDESEGEIRPEDFARLVTRVAESVERLVNGGMERPTEFELITATAFLHFAESRCDVVVLEVGLGGIYDSTNVIPRAEACVITAMGYDHMDRLGGTMAEITENKAGIIKPGCRTILYDPDVACDTPEDAAAVEAVVRRHCTEKGSPLTILRAADVETLSLGIEGQEFRIHTDGVDGTFRTTLLGRHQPMNAAVAALAVLPLTGPAALAEGIAAARWLVRQEIVRREDPTILIDGSHNPQSVRELTDTLARIFPGRGIVFVCGVMADKDHGAMLRMVLENPAFRPAAFIAVTPDNPRAMRASDLIEEARRTLASSDLVKARDGGYNKSCMLLAIDDPTDAAGEAVRLARADGYAVCVFGSLYMVGPVRERLRNPTLSREPQEGEV